MPLFRRVPKHGFTSPFRKEYSIANVRRLQTLVDDGRIDDGADLTPEQLEDLGIVRSAKRVKILGDGDLSAGLSVSAHAFSASAREKIEAAGGSVTVLDE